MSEIILHLYKIMGNVLNECWEVEHPNSNIQDDSQNVKKPSIITSKTKNESEIRFSTQTQILHLQEKLEEVQERVKSAVEESAISESTHIVISLVNKKLQNKFFKCFKDNGTSLVTILNLTKNQITNEGIMILEERKWDRLEELHLSFNPIGNQAMRHFSNFTNISKLHLEECGIDADGLYTLSKLDFPKLQMLNLNNNKITDEGVEHLENFKMVVELHMKRTSITFGGFKRLIQLQMKELQRLHVSSYQIDVQGRELAKNLEESRKLWVFT